MEITVFAKERKTKEGRAFTSYVTKLLNKSTGEIETMTVKFRQACGSPDAKDCPCNIEIAKSDCNVQEQSYTREDTGETMIGKSLWVNSWAMGSEYIDHSTDEYF